MYSNQLAEIIPYTDHLTPPKPLLVGGTTWTTRLPTNATVYALAPPRTGRRGRPRLKGAPLGKAHQLAASATWRRVTVHRYGRTDTVLVASVPSIWYGPFGNTEGRTILIREPASTNPDNLALFTTDRDTPAEQVVCRYADRWTIEVAIATGKQILGVGQARNRLRRAVERTVPFAFCVQTLVTVWYATRGHHPDDLAARLAAEPWYDKTEPAFEDMLGKLRRTLIAARFSSLRPDQPEPHIIHDYALACAAAAA